MEPKPVHHGSAPFTMDRAGLRIRSPWAATVQHRSPRTVTSLVTSHTTTLPRSNTRPAPARPHRDHAAAPRTAPGDGELGRPATVTGTAHCTPGGRGRTPTAHPTAGGRP